MTWLIVTLAVAFLLLIFMKLHADGFAMFGMFPFASTTLRMRYLKKRIMLYSELGNADQALILLEEYEQRCREWNDFEQLAWSYQYQASNLSAKGEYEFALERLELQRQLCEPLNDMKMEIDVLLQQGMILEYLEDKSEAMDLYRKAEQIGRRSGDSAYLARSLINQAVMLDNDFDYDSAAALYEEIERLIADDEDERMILSISLISHAQILSIQGDLDRASELYRLGDSYLHSMNDPYVHAKLRIVSWRIHRVRNELDEAAAVSRDVLRTFQEIGLPLDIAVAKCCLADILRIQGDLNQAMALYREAEAVMRRGDNDGLLSVALTGQAILYRLAGDYERAIEVHNEELAICRADGNRIREVYSLFGQSLVLKEQGLHDRAMILLEEQERICRSLTAPEHLARTLAHQADILTGQQLRPEEAAPLAAEARQLLTRHGLLQVAEELAPVLARVDSST